MKERKIITRVDQLRNSRRELLRQDDIVRKPSSTSDPVESTEKVYADSRIQDYSDEIGLMSKGMKQGKALEVAEEAQKKA